MSSSASASASSPGMMYSDGLEGGVNLSPLSRKSHPYRALVRKTLTLQKRQKKSNCCQICCPVTGVLMIFALQLLINATTSGLGDKTTITTVALNTFANGFWGGSSILYTDASLVGTLVNGTGSGILGQIPSIFANTSVYSFPTYTNVSTLEDIDAVLFQAVQAAQGSPNLFGQQKRDAPKISAIPVSSVFVAPGQTSASLASSFVHDVFVNNNTKLRYCQDNSKQQTGMSDPGGLNGFGSPLIGDPCAVIEGMSSVNALHSSFLQSTSGVSITTYAQAMPLKYTKMSIAIDSILGSFFFPLIAYFLFPVFLFLIVIEKQERLREFAKMNGMKMRHYWFMTFVFDYGMYFISTCIFFVMCAVFQFKFVLNTNPFLYLFLYFLWGVALVVWAIFMSTFLGRGNTATILGYALVLVTGIAAPILELFVFQDTNQRPFFYMMYPFFAFCHGLIHLLERCSSYRCLGLSDITSTDPWVQAVGWLIFDIVFYLALGLYLDLVLPSQYGVRKHPLFCFPRFNEKKRYAALAASSKQSKSERTSLMSPAPSTMSGVIAQEEEAAEAAEEVEDHDVQEERSLIERGSIQPDERAIFIKNLRKMYKTNAGLKLAVKDLCLAMKQGECFSLLGPNGAGKSTTISILTGLYPPTSGSVYVCGFDVATQRDRIHLNMGVCPQFDTIWEDLSPKDHLLFYARLKGIGIRDEQAHVEDVLKRVGLAGDIGNRPSKTLSGGMKRRLSIAISLVGDPRVIVLDEPTTGLDPTTRRHLWDIIASAKKGRCILLTTHAMDEAETLSDRIGIMSLGRLKCLGTQLHLKNKFGQGYRISTSFDESDAGRVISMMKEIAPTSQIVSQFAGTATFEVPRKDILLSNLFAEMESRKETSGVKDWGVSNTSLEDVFLELVRDEQITPAVPAK
eukprot:ANDGO_03522.mRNA.1 ABC transporter A family member 7